MSLLNWPVGVAMASLSVMAFASPPQDRFYEGPGCNYHEDPWDLEYGLCESDGSQLCLGTCTKHVSMHPAGYIQIRCTCVNNVPG